MKQFDFVGRKKIFFGISILLILAGIVGLFVNGGFNYDIEFTGGTEITISMENTVDGAVTTVDYATEDIVELVKSTAGVDTAQVQKVDGGKIVSIRTQALEAAERTAIFEAVKEKYSLEAEGSASEENFGEATSKRILASSLYAVLIAVALMLVYITIRFEFFSGLAAFTGLLHDVLIMLSFYAIFRSPVNNSFVAAVLTIIGYSINNTIIIFDRVRENSKKYRSLSFEDIMNKSIQQTLPRTINTSITTLLTIGMVYILGVSSMKEFALPIIIGLIAGTYSSIFICGACWTIFKNKFRRRPKGAKRVK